MEDQYGMADLSPYINSGRPIYTAIPPSPQPLPPPPLPAELVITGHQNMREGQQYEMVMVGRQGNDIMPLPTEKKNDIMPFGLRGFLSDSATTANVKGMSGFEMESGGGDGGGGRWPRQETLTLLEIRSRLDFKFKEANQKGPMWDEVSRTMSEEHGYQRSGKKCREKFENLYKYYKKTKEGNAGRQDGKHYRFFRQLEALYGETNNPISVSETNFVGPSFGYNTPSINTKQPNQEFLPAQRLCDSLSLSNSSEFDTSSSDDNASVEKRKKRRCKRRWKAKIREFMDAQMRKIMEKQEAWLEKMMKTIEHKEQNRMLREEVWRKQEAARMDNEHRFWANERAWIEARDASLMEALHKLTGKEMKGSSPNQVVVTELRSVDKTNEQGLEFDHGALPPKLNAGSAVHDSCFRFLMGDAENVWENYGVKLYKGEND